MQFPYSKEYISAELMGKAAQRLSTAMNVTRQEQDAFALRSHQLAASAYDKGFITDIFPLNGKFHLCYFSLLQTFRQLQAIGNSQSADHCLQLIDS